MDRQHVSIDIGRVKTDISRVKFDSHGNTLVYSADGERVVCLYSWDELYIDYMQKNGIDVKGIQFEMPSGVVYEYIEDEPNNDKTYSKRIIE